MSISANYPTPVTVNGFICKNCTDVDDAKKHIDPAHPQDGPYGIDAHNALSSKRGPAVTLGGNLSAAASAVAQGATSTTAAYAVGSRVNLTI